MTRFRRARAKTRQRTRASFVVASIAIAFARDVVHSSGRFLATEEWRTNEWATTTRASKGAFVVVASALATPDGDLDEMTSMKDDGDFGDTFDFDLAFFADEDGEKEGGRGTTGDATTKASEGAKGQRASDEGDREREREIGDGWGNGDFKREGDGEERVRAIEAAERERERREEEARKRMDELFDEASKFGFDFAAIDDGDGNDGGDDAFEDAFGDALAAVYSEEEDDSEDEAAIEARKQLLLQLGVNIDEEPSPPAVVRDPEPTPIEKEAEATARVASAPASDPVPVVQTLPRTPRRTLLSTIDIDSVTWLGWNSMPDHVQQRVSATSPESADVRVVRAGGYWRAESTNTRRKRQSKSRNGFPLRRGQEEPETKDCNQRHALTSLQCFGENSRHVVITVEGNHTFLPGDYISFERIGSPDMSIVGQMNRQNRVYAIPAPFGTKQETVNWDDVWSTSPLLDATHSVFAVTFDTPGIACGAFPNLGAIVRRSANPNLSFC